MAMRLRKFDGAWLAVCAAQSPGPPGDVYIDDGQDHAIRVKLYHDWESEGLFAPALTNEEPKP